MSRNIFLNLLILCAILSQVIIATFVAEDIKESSSFLVRQKRVISHLPFEDRAVLIEEHPYVVHLKYLNRIYCVGSILSHRVVITVAECVQYHESEYKVISSSVRTNQAVVSHNVTQIKRKYGGHPQRSVDGIALLTIDPAIVYGRFSNKIDIHTLPTLPDMIGTVTGWGFNYKHEAGRGTQFPRELRSIQVPIISHQECVDKYRPFFTISEMDICTFHPERHAGHNDFGAPLVIDGLLVGIFLHSGPLIQQRYNPQFPDVFAFLQHIYYNSWIRNNI